MPACTPRALASSSLELTVIACAWNLVSPSDAVFGDALGSLSMYSTHGVSCAFMNTVLSPVPSVDRIEYEAGIWTGSLSPDVFVYAKSSEPSSWVRVLHPIPKGRMARSSKTTSLMDGRR